MIGNDAEYPLRGKYYLTADLMFDPSGVNFIPIGSEGSPFTGKFDGNGHTISGIKIEVSGSESSAGLFAYT